MTTKTQKQVEYISYGGGTPSLALIILNVQGKIKPITGRDKVDKIIFADTGWERTDTMNQIGAIRDYCTKHGFDFEIVKSNYGSLETYLYNNLTKNENKGILPIPYHSKDKGIGQRQCTNQFKISPINQYLRKLYGPVGRVAQLGIHFGEWQRVKDARNKKDTNRFPLVDLQLKRADCVTIVEEAGLPSPPKSACVGCPYLPASRFIELNQEHPKDFERAEKIDKLMNPQGKYLSSKMIPLSSLKKQLTFSDLPDVDYSCESGYCFT